MVRYTVPTSLFGTVTRTSARHLIENPVYRFVAVHAKAGKPSFVTWHSTRELAAKASQYGSHVVEVAEIRTEHCSAKRG
jgi:hypothetical protein